MQELTHYSKEEDPTQNNRTRRTNFVEEARSYLGSPFIHAGRSHLGLDCIGLLIVAGKKFGLVDYDNVNYSSIVNEVTLITEIERYGYRIRREDIELGDVFLMGTDGLAHHVAIVSNISPLRIIHASPHVRKVVEHGMCERWESRIMSCYRWKKWVN